MKKKKKVLFFMPMGVGGAERMTITIAKMLPPDRYVVKFVIVDKQYGEVLSFIPKGYDVGLVKIRNIFDFTTFRLYKLLKNEKPDIVFCSLIYLSTRVIIAARLLGGIKIIVRSNIGLNVVHGINYKLCKATYPKADYVIAQQDEMRKEIINRFNINSDKVITLQNPIDTETIDTMVSVPSPYDEESSVKYVWTGSVSYRKGQDVLIKAFAKVQETIPDSRLFIVGKYDENGAFYQSLLKLQKELNVQDLVTFVGYDSNPYKWEKHCDCFVQPSRNEGLPNALLEAMYLGKPVVATRCLPVIDRIVKDGFNGYIVNPDDIDALAEAMIKAIKLHDFEMIYKSASKEDFIRLFES